MKKVLSKSTAWNSLQKEMQKLEDSFKADIKIEEGYYWEESSYIFKDYIEYMFKAKQEATKGTPAYTTAKICLNALYGIRDVLFFFILFSCIELFYKN